MSIAYQKLPTAHRADVSTPIPIKISITYDKKIQFMPITDILGLSIRSFIL
jgi:hypothetical protein